MANTQQVHIDAYVPFDWLSNLTDEEAKVFAAYLLSPCGGLKLRYPKRQGSNSFGVKNVGGGITTMYHLRIEGTEAISNRALVIIANAVRRLHNPGDLTRPIHAPICESRDLDDNQPWYTIRTPEEQDAAEKRASEWVKKTMEGKEFVRTDDGSVPGVERYELQPIAIEANATDVDDQKALPPAA